MANMHGYHVEKKTAPFVVGNVLNKFSSRFERSEIGKLCPLANKILISYTLYRCTYNLLTFKCSMLV